MVTEALLPHVSHRFPLVPGVSACAVPRLASDGGYVVRASSNLRLRPTGVCPTRHPEWGGPRRGGAARIPSDSCLRVAPLGADLDDIGLPQTPGGRRAASTGSRRGGETIPRHPIARAARRRPRQPRCRAGVVATR